MTAVPKAQIPVGVLISRGGESPALRPGCASRFSVVLGEGNGLSKAQSATLPALPSGPLRRPLPIPAQPPPSAAQAVGRVLDLGSQVDALLARVQGAAPMSPQELLATQALLYRYDEGIELLSQVTDRVSAGVKEVLHTST